MTINEQLIEKKAALSALKERIEANEPDAIKEGSELMKSINSLEASAKSAEQAAKLLKSIGTNENKKEENTMEEKTVFENFLEQAGNVDKNVKGWSVSAHVKAATDVTTIGANIVDTDRSVSEVPAVQKVADRFLNVTVSGNAVTYFVQNVTEGKAAVTAEGAKKPQLHVSFTPKTEALKKIAGYTKETDEVLSDAPFLASAVENTLVYELGTTENSTIITDIAGTSGIGADTHDGTALGMVEKVLSAKTTIKKNTGFAADVVFMNPSDIEAIKLLKDTNGNYLFGGPSADKELTLWGLPVDESADLTAGTFLVIAGKKAVKVYRKGGADVKVYEQNEDDAIYNRVTIIAEERALAAVVAPAAVIKVTP